MKNFIIGLTVGLIFGAVVGFAADRNIILQSSDGIAISASNPLPIQIN